MFWGDLNTPESYATDWYNALTNQSSHFGWAALIVCFICALWGLYYGEMPYKWTLWLTVVFSYSFFVEYVKQGWKRLDSPNDTYFIALGAAGPLVSLYEARFNPEIVLMMTYDGWGFIIWASVVIVSFAAHVVPRIIRKIKTENKT